jgi:hypothetical protein
MTRGVRRLQHDARELVRVSHPVSGYDALVRYRHRRRLRLPVAAPRDEAWQAIDARRAIARRWATAGLAREPLVEERRPRAAEDRLRRRRAFAAAVRVDDDVFGQQLAQRRDVARVPRDVQRMRDLSAALR